jgi:pimeloyl-ACP methyl ester carboxylesterase
VLVGHSIGGSYARILAARFPSEIVGVVLVGSSHPDQREPAIMLSPINRMPVFARRLVCNDNCVMVMRRPHFRNTVTWLVIRSAVQSIVWQKKSSVRELNWSQVLNWSHPQLKWFVLRGFGAGDGNRIASQIYKPHRTNALPTLQKSIDAI